jgi:outer membrane protein TolC
MDRFVRTAALVSLLLCAAPTAASAESLEDAWAQALACNAQLAASQLEETAAVDDLAATAAERRPSAWLSGAYSVRSDERNFKLANPLFPSQTFVAPYAQQEGAGASASVAMPLYTSGRIASAIGGAKARLAAASFGAKTSRLELLLAVGDAYVNVLRAQSRLAVADQTLASLVGHETKVQRQIAQQRSCKNDLLAAQVATANAQQARLRKLHALESARGEFNRLLGRPLTTPVELDELALAPVASSFDELQHTAWQRRPDLAELQAAATARQFEADRLRAESRPELSAVGRYDFDENRFQTPQAVTTAAIVVDWNVYDGGRGRRAACAELSRAASLQKLVEDLRSRISLEVLTQWNSQQEALQRLEVAMRGLEHADESLRVSQLRFDRGLAVNCEVLDAQARRAQAASDFFTAGYDLCMAQIRLRYAAGILEPEASRNFQAVEPLPSPVESVLPE